MKHKWQSVDEQIARAKAPPGSALEKLIRENQDGHVLHPSESEDDDSDLPSWLRIYWRKQHPELAHPAVNPTAGYPDVLYTMHEWMKRNPDLPVVKGSAPEPGDGDKGDAA